MGQLFGQPKMADTYSQMLLQCGKLELRKLLNLYAESIDVAIYICIYRGGIMATTSPEHSPLLPA